MSSSFYWRNSTRSAFTLIELLCVIAVIGLLAAITLAAIGRARDAARKVACASNLRQIGQAMSMYTTDNRQKFPPMKGEDGNYWTAHLVPYAGEIKERNRTIFICPGSKVDIIVAQDFASGGRTYGASRLILGAQIADASVSTLRFDQIVHPSMVILAADSNQVPGNNGNSTFDLNKPPFNSSQTRPPGISPSDILTDALPNEDKAPGGYIRFRHNGDSANALMVDGHVETVRPGKIKYANIYPLE
ncbi:prepilin-type N-terminal cleavage/methylation domain-containing protein [Opitutaceae bacterium TAV1]|nr:prepilin-type N-terminal cleavage/methylation domain-containing protein [Opitutaceae bacterium TAV1]